MSVRRLAWALLGLCVAACGRARVRGPQRRLAATPTPSARPCSTPRSASSSSPTRSSGAADCRAPARQRDRWLFLVAGLGARSSTSSFSATRIMRWSRTEARLPGGELAARGSPRRIWFPCLAGAIADPVPSCSRRAARRRGAGAVLVWVIGVVRCRLRRSRRSSTPGRSTSTRTSTTRWGSRARRRRSTAPRGVASPVLFLVALVARRVGVRFRRSRGVERQQLKWLFYAGSLRAACLPRPDRSAIGLESAACSSDVVFLPR